MAGEFRVAVLGADEPAAFAGAAPGVFTLLQALDDKYREHVRPKGEAGG